MTNNLYELRAQVVKALAHPLRLQIIDLLSNQEEMCVCELVAALKCDQPTVSKHLNLMKGAGIIRSRKEGNKMLYQLCMPCAVNFLSCIDRVLQHDLEARRQELADLVQNRVTR